MNDQDRNILDDIKSCYEARLILEEYQKSVHDGDPFEDDSNEMVLSDFIDDKIKELAKEIEDGKTKSKKSKKK